MLSGTGLALSRHRAIGPRNSRLAERFRFVETGAYVTCIDLVRRRVRMVAALSENIPGNVEGVGVEGVFEF